MSYKCIAQCLEKLIENPFSNLFTLHGKLMTKKTDIFIEN